MEKLKRFGKKELLENATKYQLKKVETIDGKHPHKMNIFVIDHLSQKIGYINLDLFCKLRKRCTFAIEHEKTKRTYFTSYYIYTIT